MYSVQPLTLSPTKAAAFLGIGKTKMLALIRAKRIQVKMLDGRIRVSTAALQAFHDTLPDYVPGKPVMSAPAIPARAQPKHGRRKATRR